MLFYVSIVFLKNGNLAKQMFHFTQIIYGEILHYFFSPMAVFMQFECDHTDPNSFHYYVFQYLDWSNIFLNVGLEIYEIRSPIKKNIIKVTQCHLN